MIFCGFSWSKNNIFAKYLNYTSLSSGAEFRCAKNYNLKLNRLTTILFCQPGKWRWQGYIQLDPNRLLLIWLCLFCFQPYNHIKFKFSNHLFPPRLSSIFQFILIAEKFYVFCLIFYSHKQIEAMSIKRYLSSQFMHFPKLTLLLSDTFYIFN